MTPRLLACLAVLVPVACAELTSQPTPTADATDAPALTFTLLPDSLVPRPHHVTVTYLATLPLEHGLAAFYRVRVLGVPNELLIHTEPTMPVDAQLRDLRNQADDAARDLVRRAVAVCDSVVRRPPSRAFGLVCA